MLRSYFKIAWRNLLRNKSFTVINILGLALGITACLLIYLITGFELSYDTFHADKERIYRAVSIIQTRDGEKHYAARIPNPATAAIRTEFTGVDKVTAFYNYYATVKIAGDYNTVKTFDAAKAGAEPSDIIIADTGYFNLFQYQWIAGSPATFAAPFQVVLTEDKARKYFGDVPAGELPGREIIYSDSLRLIVAGIVKGFDKNTDLNFKDFISFATIPNSFLKNRIQLDNWHNWDRAAQIFVKLARGTTPVAFEKQMAAIAKREIDMEHNLKATLLLQPLSDIHFNALYTDTYGRRAHLPTLYALMGIAFFILLIAAVNFINLSTAQSLRRTKEIGIRKVLGSRRSALTGQFLSETLILTLFAVTLSVLVTQPLLSVFHSFIPEGVHLMLNAPTLLFLTTITIVTALLAGLYPAKVLSSFLPAISLKGASSQKAGQKNYLRKGLIIFQFTISVAFIIGTLIIGRQINYVLHTDLGFAKDAIITIPTNPGYAAEKKDLLASQIRQIAGIQMVSTATGSPLKKQHSATFIQCRATGRKDIPAQYQTGDENFISLYQLHLIAGRNLLRSDTMKEFLINETCLRQLGFQKPEDALGKLLETGAGGKKGPIVGVLADFHSQTLHEPIAPTFISTDQSLSRTINVKLATQGKEPGNFRQTIASIEKSWKAVYPNEKFEYSFFDEAIARYYEKEQQTEQIMDAAMLIAIFISCMGLFGMATYNTQQRTKEIGIRKVLGASVTSITAMLSKDFLKPVMIAIIIASPVAYFFMQKWLQNFAYRIDISWWVFAVAGLSAVLIALLTISFQAIKSAIANPVKTLRSE